MKTLKLLFAIVLLSIGYTAVSAQGIYLFMQQVTNGKGTGAHEDEVKIATLEYEIKLVGTAVTGGGLGAGKAEYKDAIFTKSIDAASMRLMQMLASGENGQVMEFRFYEGEGAEERLVYKVELGAYIFTDHLGSAGLCDGGCTTVAESFSVNFRKMRATNYKTSPPSEYKWDLRTNSASF
ncbi:type VI secretion system tube protein Hcp [Dyadobacter arcticus]|uniref:Type VI protein secretion system component Hcp n=1 Tax=Dyadobacter arcticus TaxID=1078754 RepID=A0ABX0UUL6_9BACT|nr:type VI secretion system tube protein Hcp [Dyadobacter arcticus]NIJ55460.1 type VI protein secretion system component Hcp [Dyadobacter arcticus]